MNGHEGYLIGRIAGIPVRLSRSWFLLTILIIAGYGSYLSQRFVWLGPGAYLAAFAFAVLLAISVLIHELSHGLTAKGFGWSVSGINLTLMGGHTTFRSSHATAGRSAIVSLAGPVANLVLAGIGWGLLAGLDWTGWPALVLCLITTSNGFVGLFNLLPGIPLDGGYAVEALAWKVTKNRDTGTRTAGVVGYLAAAGLIAWLILSGTWHNVGMIVLTMMVAFIVISGSSQAFRNVHLRQAVDGISVVALARPTTAVRLTDRLSAFPPLEDPRGVYLVTDDRGQARGVVDAAAMAEASAVGDNDVSAEGLMVSATWDRPVPEGLQGHALMSFVAQLPGRIWPVKSWDGQPTVLFESDVIEAVRCSQRD